MPNIRTRAAKGSKLTIAEADANFKRTVAQKTTTYQVLIGDNRSIIEGNHASIPFTITLPPVATADNAETGDFEVTFTNINIAVVSVDGSGSETIDGSTDVIALGQWESVTIQLDSAQTGWKTIGSGGKFVQEVYVQDGAVATSTTVMPADTSIPQNTEGLEVMTLAITPKNAANILYIDVVIFGAHSAGGTLSAALFQDSTASALSAGANSFAAINNLRPMSFTHRMVAGTIVETIFKIRSGASLAGTYTFNGISAGVKHGGVMASSITIREYTP